MSGLGARRFDAMARWLAITLAWPAAAAACPAPPEGMAVVADGATRIAWRAEPQRIVVGQPFRLLIDVCPGDARLTRVDATMPEHRHGMNYRPQLVRDAAGRWQADGLLWHMAGSWEIVFELSAGDRRQRLATRVELQ